ncbi:PLP-dependent transferase [Nonomuraea salmonea]|uniref:PLP-dependent transferase n=1 Tax=Nonomuraea salmonea TaxID=46181 RepID=UPI0031EC5B32
MLGAVNPPVFENSLFTFETAEELGAAVKDEDERYVYWRGTNPTVDLAQRKLAALERGERAKCFGSGMGAISATISSLVSAGDHVLVLGAVYGPTTQFLRYLEKFGVSHTHVDDLAAGDSAIRPSTRILYFESPSYMAYQIVDITEVTAWARERGLLTVMDNTWSTPLFQKPLTMGGGPRRALAVEVRRRAQRPRGRRRRGAVAAGQAAGVAGVPAVRGRDVAA